MCVTSSVARRMGNRLAATIGVCIVKCHERYLGLSRFIGKNKKQLFEFIKDRLWQKIHGWSLKVLSVGGKEVLIKAFLQAIPAYAMSLFRLLKGLIMDIQILCCKFWWGSTDAIKKIHWGSWERMCVGKEDGGINF
ncbi:hypothetical protein Dsin_022330 [Dipteronia sinensis]|uniref:Uncharacterized protein n=1 Tax=Dipteronia sinensis TaxID=43782 RepID=A0AAE0A1C0_9ROSI|nr:hypothetical protein Dsin_022330 [Dipteronia sinensis]